MFSDKISKTDIVQSTGTSTTSVMSQKAISDALSKKADQTNSKQTIRAGVTWTNDIYLGDEEYKISSNNNGDLTYNGDKVMVGSTVSNEVSLVQNTGQSTTSVMSQKAVSDAIAAKEDVANKVTTLDANATDEQYPSAKAVKVALSELEEKISYNSEEQADFLTGILIWYETTSEHVGGETTTSDGYSSTNFIDTNSVVSVETNAIDFAGVISCIAFYDDSKVYLGGLNNQSNKRVVNAEDFPIGTKYIRFSTNTIAQPNHYAKIFKSTDIKDVLDDTIDVVNQIKIENEKYNNLREETLNIPFKLGCYISSGVNQGQPAGELITDAGDAYAATKDFYLLDNAVSIVFKCASWGRTIFNIAFYDENKVYIENSGSIYSSAEEIVIESKDFPVGAKYARFSHQVSVSSSYYAKYNNVISAIDVLNGIIGKEEISGYWAACGDSITHANHNGIYDIDINDAFCPFDNVHGIPSGTASIYRRKNYAYYVAKEMKLKWANYGWGGTTMHNCTYNGIFLNGFSVDRYKQFADGVDFNYISIFFGYNDAEFGVYAQKEKWLSETYGGTIYYPIKIEDIGKVGFATQEQKDAVDAVTGVVNGVNYDNNSDYFIAKMVGTIDDTDNTTFMGAFDVVLPYLINKYPLSKILLIVPYAVTYDNVHESGPNKMMRDSVIEIARKWNVAYYDFRESCPFLEKSDAPMIGYADLRDFRERTLTADRLHPNNDGYKYIYRSILNKLKSL